MQMILSPISSRINRWITGLLLFIASCLAVVPVQNAYATSDTTILFETTALGLVTGTVVGLATYPVHQSGRGIVAGAIFGAMLGLGVGIYHINYRDDPNNPIRMRSEMPPTLDHETPYSDRLVREGTVVGIEHTVLNFY